MAERVTQKVKRKTAPARQVGRAAPAETKRTNGERIVALEKECDQLKAQLASARAQIIRLEQARDEAVSRIDWALDSLHNVLESDA
jgi:hypothetical protein